MENVDASDHFEQQQQAGNEQTPSLLTVILDTNPAAWSLIRDTLPLSKAVANILVFINAHLACNYTNKVAVIASHSNKAQWLYPTTVDQKPIGTKASGTSQKANEDSHDEPGTPSNKRARRDVSYSSQNGSFPKDDSNKYRPFRIVEEQITQNLTNLLTSTSPSSVSLQASTMVAGALSLALSYINRETIAYNESLTGTSANVNDASAAQGIGTDPSSSNNALPNVLQSRILLITISPSTDLAHQYIPIMNSIFACQRLNIPIDVLQIPLPSSKLRPTSLPLTREQTTKPDLVSDTNATVFLQQAADATKGIFIPVTLTQDSQTENPNLPPETTTEITTKLASSALLTYLLTAFLPSPSTRKTLILPTRIDVDFRAACFCHRNIISTGFVCSICLSIFCSVPEGNECLTCGTILTIAGSGYGARPIVVPKKKKKKAQRAGAGGGNGVDTLMPA